MIRTAADRLYTSAKRSAVDTLGGPRAFEIQAPMIRRAFIASAILDLLYAQNESIRAETVRGLMGDLLARLTDDAAHEWREQR